MREVLAVPTRLPVGPKVTLHDARHAFASQLADLDLTSGDLAPILGHSTAGITEAIYVHAFKPRGARGARPQGRGDGSRRGYVVTHDEQSWSELDGFTVETECIARDDPDRLRRIAAQAMEWFPEAWDEAVRDD